MNDYRNHSSSEPGWARLVLVAVGALALGIAWSKFLSWSSKSRQALTDREQSALVQNEGVPTRPSLSKSAPALPLTPRRPQALPLPKASKADPEGRELIALAKTCYRCAVCAAQKQKLQMLARRFGTDFLKSLKGLPCKSPEGFP